MSKGCSKYSISLLKAVSVKIQPNFNYIMFSSKSISEDPLQWQSGILIIFHSELEILMTQVKCLLIAASNFL